MPRKSDSAPLWWYPANILIGLVAGYFWSMQHIANNDGVRDASHTGTAALAILGGIVMAVITTKAHKPSLTAFCVGIIAFGVGAVLQTVL